MTYALELRETHKYVGAYSYLDEWKYVGTYDAVGKAQLDIEVDEEDMTDPKTTVLIVDVETYQPEHVDTILRALKDAHTSVGCGHEYDCCGCRSYYAHANHVEGNRYMVTVSSSRNY